MIANIISQCWTYELINNILFITKDYNLTVISVLSSVGSTTITGSLTANGIPSAPITLLQGQVVNISSGVDSNIPLDGIEIQTAGTAIIIGR